MPDQRKRVELKKTIQMYRGFAKDQMLFENESVRNRLLESQKDALEAEFGEVE
jgi:hypothetical protein